MCYGHMEKCEIINWCKRTSHLKGVRQIMLSRLPKSWQLMGGWNPDSFVRLLGCAWCDTYLCEVFLLLSSYSHTILGHICSLSKVTREFNYLFIVCPFYAILLECVFKIYCRLIIFIFIFTFAVSPRQNQMFESFSLFYHFFDNEMNGW